MKNLLWLDLETTGLNPRIDTILSVAAARTDDAGVIVDEREWVLFSAVPNSVMDPVVVKMHTENGLLARCRSHEGRWANEVRTELLEFVGSDKPILAGNSIHFDRSFLAEYMPGVVDALHYRMLDVSTLKVAAGIWGLPGYKKVKKHLALDDVKASIAEFLHWKKEFGR